MFSYLFRCGRHTIFANSVLLGEIAPTKVAAVDLTADDVADWNLVEISSAAGLCGKLKEEILEIGLVGALRSEGGFVGADVTEGVTSSED